MPQDRLNIAVFIDFDNIEIGVKSTLGEHLDIGSILEAIKERGEVVTKIAYADWTRAGEYSRALTQHAIRLVQRNLTPGGDKNGADINLALDALEMAFTHPHINAYVIVGGDSDFLSLVEKLKQYDKKVFVVGGRAFTSGILQRNCHEFIAYENLAGVRKTVVKGGRPTPPPAALPITQAFPLVRRALKILADREVTPQTGLLKSTLLQLDSTFSERNYGASSFLDFVEKLAQAGLVQLKHAGRSVMVELNEGFTEDPEVPLRAGAVPVDRPVEPRPQGRAPHEPRETGEGRPEARAVLPQDSLDGSAEIRGGTGVFDRPTDARPDARSLPDADGRPPAGEGSRPGGEVVVQTESGAEGVRLVGQILTAATAARWPMYLRNVKQILRAADRTFDERRYGFGGLLDLLRACQREGLVRIERDRRGGLRVFQGAGLQRPVAPPSDTIDTEPSEPSDMQPFEALAAPELIDAESSQPEREPIDSTAELLGRAKARPRRTRPGVPPRKAAPRAASTAAPRKPSTARRGTRSKKTAAADAKSERTPPEE